MKIFEICNYLIDNGIDFITEAVGKNGKWRADVLAMTFPEGRCYEVYSSETEKRRLEKNIVYPFGISYVKAEGEFKEEDLY